MKLHWSPKSPYVRKVMICAHELNLVECIETVRSVVALVKPNDNLMLANPLSKIPALVLDDGFVLFDSVVICEYLNDMAGGSLFPPTGLDKWRTLRWHALSDGLLDALVLWRNERDEREAPQLDLMDAYAKKTRATLTRLDAEASMLDEMPLSIGHITVGCALGYLDYRFATFDWRVLVPRLAEWYTRLCRRPSFQATGPVDG